MSAGDTHEDVGHYGGAAVFDPPGLVLRVSRLRQGSAAPIIDAAMCRDWIEGADGRPAVSMVRHGVVIVPWRLWLTPRDERPIVRAVSIAWRRRPFPGSSPRLKLYDLLGNRPRVRRLVGALSEVIW